MIVVFGNAWIWFILGKNIWLGLVIVSISLLWKLTLRNNNRLRLLGLVILTGVLLWQQWVTTNGVILTVMEPEEQFIRQERVQFYPEWFRRVGGWWELRHEFVGLRNIGGNFFQTIDLNYYFFANHPREELGIPNIEKFPFWYLPLFIIGVYRLMLKSGGIRVFGMDWLGVLGFAVPVGLLSLMGHDNPWGPFVLFPGLIVVIWLGLDVVMNKLINLFKNRSI